MDKAETFHRRFTDERATLMMKLLDHAIASSKGCGDWRVRLAPFVKCSRTTQASSGSLRMSSVEISGASDFHQGAATMCIFLSVAGG